VPYITQWEEHGIYWQLSGIVTADEIFQFTNEFYNDGRSDSIHYQIVDCSRVEQFKLEEETMMEVAALDYAASLSIVNVKVALVGKAEHLKKVNNNYIDNAHMFHCKWLIENFDTLAAARAWLAR